ncbi:MAG: TolC family protein [Gemmatimonadota bacterium]
MQTGTRYRCLLRVVLLQLCWIGVARAAPYRRTLPPAVPGGPTYVSDTLRLTLEGALARARRDNLELRSARLDTAIALGVERQARLWPFNPVVDALSAGAAGGVDYGVSQEVEFPGKAGPRRTAAREGVARARAASANAERLTLGNAARGFYRLVAAGRRREVAAEVLQLNQRLADAVTRQLAEGEVNRITYNLAAIELGRSRSNLLSAQREERIARLALGHLLGISPTVEIVPDVNNESDLNLDLLPPDSLAQVVTPADTFDVVQLIAVALSRRPDLTERTAAARQASANAAGSRRAALPNLLLRLTSEEIGPGERTLRPGVGIAVPLFNRNQGDASAFAAAATQAEQDSRAIAARVAVEIEGAVADYVAAAAEVATLRSTVLRAGRQNRELSETAYREGKIGLPEILLIRNQAISAELDYWSAWLAEREARVTLAEATGQDLFPSSAGVP